MVPFLLQSLTPSHCGRRRRRLLALFYPIRPSGAQLASRQNRYVNWNEASAGWKTSVSTLA